MYKLISWFNIYKHLGFTIKTEKVKISLTFLFVKTNPSRNMIFIVALFITWSSKTWSTNLVNNHLHDYIKLVYMSVQYNQYNLSLTNLYLLLIKTDYALSKHIWVQTLTVGYINNKYLHYLWKQYDVYYIASFCTWS